MAAEILTTGERLIGVEALIGSAEAARWAAAELQMSRSTALRLIRVARVFRHHPRPEALAVKKPTVLYELSEPSFPAHLRERILSGHLVVDGERRTIDSLRVREVVAAKAQWMAAEAERARAQRQLANLGEDDPKRGALKALSRRAAAARGHVATSAPHGTSTRVLERVIEGADVIADDVDALPSDVRSAAREALRKILDRLE